MPFSASIIRIFSAPKRCWLSSKIRCTCNISSCCLCKYSIPDSVLAQLSNRIQHALRAYTPAEQKAVKAAAQAFRENPAFKAADVIMELGVGEALVSVLDDAGVPCIVQRTAIVCPQSLMAPAQESTRRAALAADGMEKYDQSVDSTSAYELLQEEQAQSEKQAALDAEREAFEKEKAAFEAQKAKDEAAAAKRAEKEAEAQRKKLEKALEREEAQRQRAAERRKAQLERQLINTGAQVLKRGLMGTLFGGRK
nr:helicase HerA-like domain-containing protein [uncultured Oscillibacter sp.]